MNEVIYIMTQDKQSMTRVTVDMAQVVACLTRVKPNLRMSPTDSPSPKTLSKNNVLILKSKYWEEVKYFFEGVFP
jgi:hypothetical protein